MQVCCGKNANKKIFNIVGTDDYYAHSLTVGCATNFTKQNF